MHMRRLVLHLGAHRTGTTSLQAALDHAQRPLHDAGVVALVPPRPGQRKGKWLRAHYGAHQRRYARASRFLPGRMWVAPLVLRRFRRQLETRVDPRCQTLILSEEEFLGVVFDRRYKMEIYPHLDSSLGLLSRFARTQPTTIFLGIRSYAEFCLSAYLMTCIYGLRTSEFAPITPASVDTHGGWVRVVTTIRRLFPDALLTVWPHETFNLAARFTRLTGCKGDLIANFPQTAALNASPTTEAIAAVRALAALRTPTKEECDELIEKHRDGTRPRVSEVFTSAEIESLHEIYARHLKTLAALPGVTVA